ncbi:hypothetical protein D3C85_174340 [compost metagenome]
MFAADQLGQEFGLLCVATVAVNLVDAQIGVGSIGQSDAARSAGDLFHGNHMSQVAHTRATILFGDGHTEQAHVAELAPQVHGELIGAVCGFRARGDFFGCKAGNGIAQHVDVFTKEEIQSGQMAHGPALL